MQIPEFKSVVTTFADPGTDLEFDSTHFGISVNGDFITAKISTKLGDVYVDEGTGAEPASKWVLARLARLPLLASRLRETVPATEHFVSPAVSLLPTLERDPDERLEGHPRHRRQRAGRALGVAGGSSPVLAGDRLDGREPAASALTYTVLRFRTPAYEISAPSARQIMPTFRAVSSSE